MNIRYLPILITANGQVASIPFPMSQDDFDRMIAMLQLWKRKLVPHPFADETGPFVPSLPLLV